MYTWGKWAILLSVITDSGAGPLESVSGSCAGETDKIRMQQEKL
jgi:hypothetical protein